MHLEKKVSARIFVIRLQYSSTVILVIIKRIIETQMHARQNIFYALSEQVLVLFHQVFI